MRKVIAQFSLTSHNTSKCLVIRKPTTKQICNLNTMVQEHGCLGHTRCRHVHGLHIFLPLFTATHKFRDHWSSPRRVCSHCVPLSPGHWRSNVRKSRVMSKKTRSWRGMRNSRPSGTSTMLFRLPNVNVFRVAMAPCSTAVSGQACLLERDASAWETIP